MLLSSSELFLVGLFKGTLSVDPLDQPDLGEYEYEDMTPPAMRILHYAEICGLEQAPIIESLNEEECALDLTQIHWGRHGKVLPASEVASIRGTLSDAIAELREDLVAEDPDGAVAERFGELLNEQAPILHGYSQATPDLLYGMRKSGRVVVTHRVKPMPPGILRVVMRLLHPHLQLPAHVVMALTTLGDVSHDWHISWVPNKWHLDWPVGTLDRVSAVSELDNELLGLAKEEPACRLGCHIAQADQLLREMTDWLRYEMKQIDDAWSVARTLDYFPPRSASDDENDDGEASSEEFTGFEELLKPKPQSNPEEDVNEWTKEIREAAKSARAQVIKLGGVYVPELDSQVAQPLKELLAQLEAAKNLAQSMGLDPCIPTLIQGIAATRAIIEEGRQPPNWSAGKWLEQQVKRREKLLEYAELLTNTVPLIFGELRLRDLQCEPLPQGVGPQALDAYTRLLSNSRAAIRQGFAMLRMGVEPYVVINAVEPTLEAITKRLAEEHLGQYRGGDLGGMLFRLLNQAKDTDDESLAAVASVGLALRPKRNSASHLPEKECDKHDAAFFLNGLTIMLRALAKK